MLEVNQKKQAIVSLFDADGNNVSSMAIGEVGGNTSYSAVSKGPDGSLYIVGETDTFLRPFWRVYTQRLACD